MPEESASWMPTRRAAIVGPVATLAVAATTLRSSQINRSEAQRRLPRYETLVLPPQGALHERPVEIAAGGETLARVDAVQTLGTQECNTFGIEITRVLKPENFGFDDRVSIVSIPTETQFNPPEGMRVWDERPVTFAADSPGQSGYFYEPFGDIDLGPEEMGALRDVYAGTDFQLGNAIDITAIRRRFPDGAQMQELVRRLQYQKGDIYQIPDAFTNWLKGNRVFVHNAGNTLRRGPIPPIALAYINDSRAGENIIFEQPHAQKATSLPDQVRATLRAVFGG